MTDKCILLSSKVTSYTNPFHLSVMIGDTIIPAATICTICNKTSIPATSTTSSIICEPCCWKQTVYTFLMCCKQTPVLDTVPIDVIKIIARFI